MDIMIAADLNYFSPALTLIVSLFHNHMEKDMNIYFLCSEFGEKEFAVLDKIEKRYKNKKIICFNISEEQTEGLRSFGRFSVGAFYRILGLEMIPTEVERILYLDVDMVVTRDITGLFEMDMTEPVLVCDDINNILQGNMEYHKAIVHLTPEDKYFNSGMILFDMEYVRQKHVRERLLDDIKDNFDRYKLVDQDALNRYYHGISRFIPWEKYNCPCVPYLSLDTGHVTGERNLLTYAELQRMQDPKNELQIFDVTAGILAEASIIHFCSEMKPWKDREFYQCNQNMQQVYKIYNRYERLAARLMK